jgi:hypothetical protein
MHSEDFSLSHVTTVHIATRPRGNGGHLSNTRCALRREGKGPTCMLVSSHVLKEFRWSRESPGLRSFKECKGMRDIDNLTPLGNIVVLEFYKPENHVLLDGMITTVYKNNYLK